MESFAAQKHDWQQLQGDNMPVSIDWWMHEQYMLPAAHETLSGRKNQWSRDTDYNTNGFESVSLEKEPRCKELSAVWCHLF